ncbi:MAG: heavy metal translocating P-type ATPase [Oligoflexus sp.]
MSGSVQDIPLQSSLKTQRACKHCGLTIASKTPTDFCCHGCETAFHLIQDLNLQDYYRIQQQLQRQPPQAKSSTEHIEELYDHPEFQASFCETIEDGRASCHLYVDNLSCYACTWVCEQAVQRLASDINVSVNLASGRALIEFHPEKTKLSLIVKRFAELGYPVSPDRNHRQQNRKDLARIGISGFCLMNLMLLAIAEYMDGPTIDAHYFQMFRWISFGLATICLVFAASPFYKNFFHALRQREIHMDMPISVAIISAYLFSTYHVFRGNGPVYFDSLTAIVFLLLVGRSYQKHAMQRHLRQSALQIKEQMEFVRRLDGDELQLVPVAKLKAGERLRILPGGMVPVKARLLTAEAQFNMELMSGEASWKTQFSGDEILAGAVNGKQSITIEALEGGMESYLQRLSAASQRLAEGKSQMAHLSKQMSQFLTSLVMLVGFTILAVYWSTPHEAIARFCAVLLIACPCAFGLGTPLILARAFDLGLQKGILWNHPRGLEQLYRVRKFFFDKTGTLTQPFGKVRLVDWQFDGISDEFALLDFLARLDQHQEHHMIRLIAEWARQRLQYQFKNVTQNKSWSLTSLVEETGQGIEVITDGMIAKMRIGRPGFCINSSSSQDQPQLSAQQTQGQTWISLNDKKIAAFDLEEQVSGDVKELFHKLNQNGIELAILSGDSSQRVQNLLQQVELPGIAGMGELSPLAKLSHMGQKQKHDLRAMVGNGFNDGPAIARAEIGIAVAGAAEMAQKNADMVLLSDRLTAILDARQISRGCRGALLRCFAFSFTYNVIGMSLGAMGLISPVVAALLMPFSSITVITLATRW